MAQQGIQCSSLKCLGSIAFTRNPQVPELKAHTLQAPWDSCSVTTQCLYNLQCHTGVCVCLYNLQCHTGGCAVSAVSHRCVCSVTQVSVLCLQEQQLCPAPHHSCSGSRTLSLQQWLIFRSTTGAELSLQHFCAWSSRT